MSIFKGDAAQPAAAAAAKKSGGGAKLLVGCLVGLGALVAVGTVSSYVLGKLACGYVEDKVEEKHNELAAVAGIAGVAGGTDSDGKVVGGEVGETYKELAEKHPFEMPEDGIIDPDRFERFLAIRKALHAEYETMQKKSKELEKSKKADFLKGMNALTMLANVKKAHAKQLKKHEMPLEEYRWLTWNVYKALFGKQMGLGEKGGGKQVAEGLAALADLQEFHGGTMTAKQKEQLAESREQLEAWGKRAEDYPKENVELMERHKVELEKYGKLAFDDIYLTGVGGAWMDAMKRKQ